MQTISIHLSDSLGDFVRRQTAECGVDDYFEKLLRERQKEQALQKLEAELMQGIESGFGEPISPEYWVKMREKLQRHLDQKKEARR